MILRRDEPFARVTVPDHKAVRIGTLKKILNDAGLTTNQFLQLMGS